MSIDFKPIYESSDDSTRNSTPIPISRGPSNETLESYLDGFRPFTPVDRENMIKESKAKGKGGSCDDCEDAFVEDTYIEE